MGEFSSEWMWHEWKVSNSSDIVQYMNQNYKPGFTYADFAKDVRLHLLPLRKRKESFPD